MRVRALWRYPVKSLQGERLDEVAVTQDGLTGDRRYAIFDRTTGLGLTARRMPELLFAAAQLRDDGSVVITLPDGSRADDDAALSGWLGLSVELREMHASGPRGYENPEDAEDERGAWMTFTGAPGPFHDSARTRVSLVSTASLGTWDPRRFRSNVVLDGAGEDELVGQEVAVGEVRLSVGKRIGRCVMTTRPQSGGIERDLDVLRTIARERDACLAVGALVVRPGTLRVGDVLERVGAASLAG